MLEYLERYKDATGEVSALMKAELRDLALTWECKPEEGVYLEANLETWEEIRDVLGSEPMHQQATNWVRLIRCPCGCLTEYDEKGKQHGLHNRFCPENLGDYARAQRFDERYGKPISDMVENIYNELESEPTQEQVRELQVRQYVPLINLFHEAEKVIDRSEGCI